MIKSLFAFAAFLAPWPGYAGDALFFEAMDASRGGKVQIRVIPAAECRATLQSILYPENTIQEGLGALAAIGSGTAPDPANVKCVQAMAGGEKALWDLSPYSLPFDLRRFDLKTNPTETSYYHNPHAERVLSAYNALRCLNPHPEKSPGAADFEKSDASMCAGPWHYAGEKEKLEKIFKDALADYEKIAPRYASNFSGQEGLYRKLAAASGLYVKTASDDEANEFFLMEKILRYPEALNYYDAPAVLAHAEKLKCYATDAKKNNPYFAEMCANKWVEEAEAVAVIKQVMEMLSSLKGTLPNLEASAKEREARIAKLLEDAHRGKNIPYQLRRLLSRYGGYVRTGGEPAALQEFCGDYERRQLRDLKYAQLGLTTVAFSSDIDWKYAEAYGLTEGELSAIKDYSGGSYRSVNAYLWKPDPAQKAIAFYHETLQSALAQLPSYSATAVKRSAQLPAGVLGDHQEGAVLKYDAYTSTSKDKNWKWHGDHAFVIYAKNGKDISELSQFGTEQEVLIPAGTRFKVLSREEAGGGKVNFVLAEVGADGAVAADLPPLAAKPAPAP